MQVKPTLNCPINALGNPGNGEFGIHAQRLQLMGQLLSNRHALEDFQCRLRSNVTTDLLAAVAA
jgi:hypothetical protein